MSVIYAVKEGLTGLRRARFAAVASVSAMTVALVLIGLFVLFGYQTRQITQWLKERVGEVELFLQPEMSEVRIQQLAAQLQAWPGIREVRYISKEEAQAIFRREFGEEGEIFLDEDFLPPSLRIRLIPAYVHPDSLKPLVTRFERLPGVQEVVFNQPLLVKVQQNVRMLSFVVLALVVTVIIGALFLLANTIRLTIYARRTMVRTMKLVGATNRFVRWPFVIEGAVQGLIAGVLSSVLLWGIAELLLGYFPQLRGQFWPGHQPYYTFGALVLLGLLLGWIVSSLSVRRFIRQVSIV